MIKNVTRAGFETAIEVRNVPRFVRAAALDRLGAVIGSSPAVDLSTGQVVELDYAVTSVLPPPEETSGNATGTTPNPTVTAARTATPSPSNSASQGVRVSGWGLVGVVSVGVLLGLR